MRRCQVDKSPELGVDFSSIFKYLFKLFADDQKTSSPSVYLPGLPCCLYFSSLCSSQACTFNIIIIIIMTDVKASQKSPFSPWKSPTGQEWETLPLFVNIKFQMRNSSNCTGEVWNHHCHHHHSSSLLIIIIIMFMIFLKGRCCSFARGSWSPVAGLYDQVKIILIMTVINCYEKDNFDNNDHQWLDYITS